MILRPTIATILLAQRSLGFNPLQQARRATTKLFSSSSLKLKNLLSVEECLELSGQDNVVFVDGSWYHKGDSNGRKDYEEGPRLPGARHVDMDDLSCQKELFPDLNPKNLGHMLPPPKLFALAMDEFGITNLDHVIVYGRRGSVFTPRTWFLFRCMGHDNVSLMQGSLEDWEGAGGPLEKEKKSVATAADILKKGGTPSYQAKQPTNVVSIEEVLSALNDETVIVDPRGSSFQSSGHIPGAKHVPYSSLVEPDNQLKLKSREDLLAIFAKAGVDVNTKEKIIASCGSGVSVCHILLALEECGRDSSKQTFMYDGSWAEWGQDPDTPKVLPEKVS